MNSRHEPPNFAIKLLRWFCKPYYVEFIEGDLREIFDRQSLDSIRKARWSFLWNTVRFFRLRYVKNIEDVQPKSSIGMLKNYFKVAIRNMQKQLAYTLSNLLGLSVGIAASLLIIVHISFQLEFDRFVPDGDRVYRMVNWYGEDLYGAYTPARLVKQMKLDYPEIESGSRISGPFTVIFKKGDSYIPQSRGMVADSTFFEVFPTSFVHGRPENALNAPNTLVLTAGVAEKFFPDENPIGQFLDYDGTPYKITAVVADPPKSTTIPYEFLMNIPYEYWATEGYWSGNNFFSYVKLKPNTNVTALENKFPDFVQRYIAPDLMKYLADYGSWEEYLDAGNFRSFKLIPLFDIHLHYGRYSLGREGSYENVVIFSMVAFFVLLIACINYINMSTARSSIRAKEVGMRKVMGSVRSTVIKQFLFESLIITVLSVALGLALAIIVLPFFNAITGMEYTWSMILTPYILLWIVLIILIVGLVAGSYPAFYLSSVPPIAALRGASVKGGSSLLRMGLVILQFAISAFLITGTFIVFRQVQHMSNRTLGVNAEQVFVIKNGDKLAKQYDAFRNSLLQQSDIEAIATSSHYPSGGVPDWGYRTRGDNRTELAPDHLFVDENLSKVLGLTVSDGAFFQGMATDTAHVVVNETLVREAGWEDPIGQTLDRGEEEIYRVIGVVEDFIMRSGRRDPRALLFRYNPTILEEQMGGAYVMVRVSGDYAQQIDRIEKQWDQFVAGYPFDGFFLDQSFNRLYNSERRFGRLFTSFSGMAIIIACIGLFALAAFTLERRLKEIAIRKVLGASVTKVVRIILWDFLKLILLGTLVAIPLVYYLGNDWLNDYEYRITLGPVILILPSLLILLAALFTVGLKTWRTAESNPVNALKQE
ncbi:MAG: ABC transporter permease [Bacteroidota bacterium]